MQNFTIEKINVAWQYLLGGFAVGAISIPAAIFPDIFMEYLIFVLPLPAFFSSAVTTLGNCMSPIAMLLTGMTIAKIDLKSTFTNLSIYAVSLLRLLSYPLVFILLCMVLKLPHGLPYARYAPSPCPWVSIPSSCPTPMAGIPPLPPA